jgi:hypothetical protein
MKFAPGLYCVTNNPGTYAGALTGSNVTFYVMDPDFRLVFEGNGHGLNATAPTRGEYEGLLIYMPPQFDAKGNLLHTQSLDLRLNSDQDTVGSIFAPSADVTLFGSSEENVQLNSQIIAYQVDSGGSANITLEYDPADNYEASLPPVSSLLFE